jgi:uncharacterized protein DUF1573
MKRSRVFSLTVILLIVFISTGINADPIMYIPEDKADFGLVPQLSKFVHDFKIYSIGDEPVIIKSLKTFDNCISGEILKSKVNPGDSAIIRITFDSQSYNGTRNRHPHILSNVPTYGKPKIKLHTNALVVDSVESLSPIYVKPYHVVASQFGDSGQTEFEFLIINVSDQTIPLKLVYADTTFYHIRFPVFVSPSDTAIGRVTLNETGLKSEFERSFTFEFIDSDQLKKHYSVPVRRKIYKK